MSLLMDALKKAEQAKHGGADDSSAPVVPALDKQPEPESAPMQPQPLIEDADSIELTLDEPELSSEADEVDMTLTLDEPETQAETDNDIALSDHHSEPADDQQKIIQPHESVSQTEPVAVEAPTGTSSPPERETVVTAEKPASNQMGTPRVDPQPLQRSALLKSRAVTSRKRLALLTLSGLALLSLLGAAYYYYDQTISKLGSSSLLLSDNVAAPLPVEDIAEPAAAAIDGLALSTDAAAQGAQGAQGDTWPLPTTAVTPLQQSDFAIPTETVQPAPQVPSASVSVVDDNPTTTATVREPLRTERPKPVARPQQKSRIHIVRERKTDPINARLLEAFHAYQAGNYTLASKQYHNVLAQDATNRHALLGLAAIAQRNADREQAADYYITLLKHDPRDSSAIAGLVSLQGASLTVENESRIKMLLDQEPQAAHLHFTLGTLYAGQSRWADAQQSFFNAHRYAPENADYAYNLAVSLDRIGKQSTALSYYRRAVKLATQQAAMFNLSEARQRITALVGLTDPIR